METKVRHRGGEILAILLIGFGAFLLLLRIFDWRIADNLWPSFIIAPGVALLAGAVFASRAQARALAVAGAVTTGTGLILLVQMLTNYFESWAYAWALLPLFSGLALMVLGMRDDDARLTASGRRLALSSTVMFVVFGAVFEGLIFQRLVPIGEGYVLPVVLITVGVLVLLRRMFPQWPERPPHHSSNSQPHT